MAAAMGYALRRTSARAVLLLGVGGLLWMVWVAPPDRPAGVVANYPIWFLSRVNPYRIVGSGFPAWDAAAVAVVAVLAVVAASVVWRERTIRR